MSATVERRRGTSDHLSPSTKSRSRPPSRVSPSRWCPLLVIIESHRRINGIYLEALSFLVLILRLFATIASLHYSSNFVSLGFNRCSIRYTLKHVW
jgi:hypothetical protein